MDLGKFRCQRLVLLVTFVPAYNGREPLHTGLGAWGAWEGGGMAGVLFRGTLPLTQDTTTMNEKGESIVPGTVRFMQYF